MNYYDYLVTNSLDVLGSEDLYEKYKKSRGRVPLSSPLAVYPRWDVGLGGRTPSLPVSSFIFELK